MLHLASYPNASDWLFASSYNKGKQPYWLGSLFHASELALEAAGIPGNAGWHTLRHTLAL